MKNSIGSLYVVKFVDNKGVSYLDHSGRFRTPDLRRQSSKSIRWAAKFASEFGAQAAGQSFLDFLTRLDPRKAKAVGSFTVLTVAEAGK